VHVLHTPYNHTWVYRVTSCKATHIQCMCLVVTCHLHFWQNNWNFLRATVATWGWNEYQNRNQHKKLTMEKKILPLLLPGLETTTLCSWVWCSTSELPPLPSVQNTIICHSWHNANLYFSAFLWVTQACTSHAEHQKGNTQTWTLSHVLCIRSHESSQLIFWIWYKVSETF